MTLLFGLSATAQPAPPRLEAVAPGQTNGWLSLSSSFHSNTLLALEASTNCLDWSSIATLHDALFQYPDLQAPAYPNRFYRLSARTRNSQDDWKNQVLHPSDRFWSTNSSMEIRWVKFAILLSEPYRVYYEDSVKFPFHYDFATQRLAPFLGMDHATFDAVSLYRTNRQAVLGSVLYPPAGLPGTVFAEYGVQFAGIDVFTPEEIARWFALVKATVYPSNGAQAFYIPSFEQAEMTRTNAAEFESRDIPVASAQRWIAQNNIYSTGWAFGRLKMRNIRFRSSTNVEDSEHFTGAGLYDSYSGCLVDDLDGDSLGPSQCDPTEQNERGVFRAVKKVYASFYNDDAFLERLRHGVDESQVGMGVLVHHSFPDAEELANGVATPKIVFTPYSTNLTGDLVTQYGAESVTNPDGTSVPEVVYVSKFNTSIGLTLKQRSSLIPLGAYVMDWQSDYRGFVELFASVANAFREYYPGRNTFWLDFEYKKDVNLGWVVKQVRQVPQPGTTNQAVPFLIDEPCILVVAQRGSTAFASHRLKSVWNLRTRNLQLHGTNLADGIYLEGSCEYAHNGKLMTLTGSLSAWPNASNSPSGTINTWTTGFGAELRRWQLDTTLVTNVSGAQPPVFTQQDLTRKITVEYSVMVPTVSGRNPPGLTNRESAFLEVKAADDAMGVLQERSFQTNALAIRTAYYWPKPPGGIVAGYTAPLLRFVKTRINGLVSQPIVLTNYYSQTYGAFHHNFFEEFVFEPRLEPGLAPSILAELVATNIQLIYVYSEGNRGLVFYALGYDGVFRSLF